MVRSEEMAKDLQNTKKVYEDVDENEFNICKKHLNKDKRICNQYTKNHEWKTETKKGSVIVYKMSNRVKLLHSDNK